VGFYGGSVFSRVLEVVVNWKGRKFVEKSEGLKKSLKFNSKYAKKAEKI
jgi:hypothetical protein